MLSDVLLVLSGGALERFDKSLDRVRIGASWSSGHVPASDDGACVPLFKPLLPSWDPF